MKNKFKSWKFALIGLTPIAILPIVTSCKIGDIGEVTPDQPTSDNVKVTFDPNGGKIEGSTETKYCYVEKDTPYFTFAHPTPTKDGFNFIGWFNSQGEKMEDQLITEDIVLTADYEQASPELADDIVCTMEDSSEWKITPESICSESEEIHLYSIETNEEKYIPRLLFNATDISIGENITTIEDNFLCGCPTFSGTITFSNISSSNLTYIGMRFMESCSQFDKPLNFPSSLKVIGSSFLYECSVFNSPISFPNLSAIGMDFMSSCVKFAQTITIPATMKYISASFMYHCYEFTNLVVEASGSDFEWTSDDASTLTVDDTSCTAYQTQITVQGAGMEEFFNIFDDVADATANNYRMFKNN